jgi:hypothetical protein
MSVKPDSRAAEGPKTEGLCVASYGNHQRLRGNQPYDIICLNVVNAPGWLLIDVAKRPREINRYPKNNARRWRANQARRSVVLSWETELVRIILRNQTQRARYQILPISLYLSKLPEAALGI